jgi:hypothetical protein
MRRPAWPLKRQADDDVSSIPVRTSALAEDGTHEQVGNDRRHDVQGQRPDESEHRFLSDDRALAS